MKSLSLSPLSKENFKEFGTIISNDTRKPDFVDVNYNWWGDFGLFNGIDDVGINILEAKKRPYEVLKLEYHQKTPEVIIPLGNEEVVLVVAPVGKMDERKIKAFKIGAGKGVVLNPGVRHFVPYPLQKDVACVIIFKEGTGATDLTFDQLGETLKITF